jgi:hypothetical protein
VRFLETLRRHGPDAALVAHDWAQHHRGVKTIVVLDAPPRASAHARRHARVDDSRILAFLAGVRHTLARPLFPWGPDLAQHLARIAVVLRAVVRKHRMVASAGRPSSHRLAMNRAHRAVRARTAIRSSAADLLFHLLRNACVRVLARRLEDGLLVVVVPLALREQEDVLVSLRAAVGHRLRHRVRFLPDDVLTKIPAGRLQREGTPPRRADKVLRPQRRCALVLSVLPRHPIAPER